NLSANTVFASFKGMLDVKICAILKSNRFGKEIDILLDQTQSGTAVILFCEKSSLDRKSTRLNSSHVKISYAVFCLKKKNMKQLSLICRFPTCQVGNKRGAS